MRILITGICGFVGSQLAIDLLHRGAAVQIVGIDNLIRPGVSLNLPMLKQQGVQVHHGDLRCASDLETLPEVDWVIDAAANPSVLAGIDGKTSTRQLVEHNLLGTINLLEFLKRCGAGLVLLSTSRVYSINTLANLPMIRKGERFALDTHARLPEGVSAAGMDETFSTQSPISLYGATKLASETLALEYGAMLDQPVVVNRCGVIAGPGQFGTAEQGIFSYWVRAYAAKRPLRYIGFEGLGLQVRDALHPADLAELVWRQMQQPKQARGLWNVGGGAEQSMSLRELSNWCAQRFSTHEVQSDINPRPFDVPWVVMNSARVRAAFGWRPTHSLPAMLEAIAQHHEAHPDWLQQAQAM